MIISILRLLCYLIPTILGPIVPLFLALKTTANINTPDPENTSPRQDIHPENESATTNQQSTHKILMEIHDLLKQKLQVGKDRDQGQQDQEVNGSNDLRRLGYQQRWISWDQKDRRD
jgi:hypothetical protein